MNHPSGIRILIWGLALSTLLLGAKTFAYFLTGSNAILSDALESIANVITGAFAIYSLVLAAKPRDLDHPYGHGKIEFVSASIEGTLVTLAGLSIGAKAIYNMMIPQPLAHLDYGIAITLGTSIVHFVIGWLIESKGKKMNSLLLIANGQHLKTDAYSSVGLMLGLLVIYLTHIYWFDSLIALLFAGFIIRTGLKILRKSVAGIMDEADFEEIDALVHTINKYRRPQWIDVHNMRAIRYGRILHIDCHLTLPWYITVQEAHHEVKQLEMLVNKDHKQELEFFVHTDPCLPSSCQLCALHTCSHRQHPFKQKVPWTKENLLSNEMHQVK
jgi:cation diffusion facilitator family transporter